MSTRSDLGSTELADTERCDRLHELKHIRQLVPLTSSEPRTVGSLIHTCLRYHYAARLPTPPAWFEEQSCFEALAATAPNKPGLIELAKSIAGGFIDRFAAADEALTVLAVEEQLRIPLREILPSVEGPARDVVVTIRPDLIMERGDGVRVMPDHKSGAGQWGRLAQWSDRNEYSLGWQPHMYLWIGRMFYERLGSFWIWRILKPAHDKYGRLTAQPDYDRQHLTISLPLYEQVPQLIARSVQRGLELRAAAAQRRPLSSLMSPWECWARGPCDYIDVCRSPDGERVLAARFGKAGDTL